SRTTPRPWRSETAARGRPWADGIVRLDGERAEDEGDRAARVARARRRRGGARGGRAPAPGEGARAGPRPAPARASPGQGAARGGRRGGAGRIVPVERGARSGDVGVVDYQGSVDGAPFEGGEGRDELIELGAGRVVPGLEEGLIGARAGEERVIDVSFPRDH